VVPSSYLDFMITAAGAAGAMIGLLFVAISLRSDMVFGVNAPAKVKMLAAICLYTTLALHARSSRTQYRLLVLTALTYAAQLAGGVTLTIRPHISWIVEGLCYVIFASFVLALTRAWQLIQADAPPTPEV
jgi:hypothetical protein